MKLYSDFIKQIFNFLTALIGFFYRDNPSDKFNKIAIGFEPLKGCDAPFIYGKVKQLN